MCIIERRERERIYRRKCLILADGNKNEGGGEMWLGKGVNPTESEVRKNVKAR